MKEVNSFESWAPKTPPAKIDKSRNSLMSRVSLTPRTEKLKKSRKRIRTAVTNKVSIGESLSGSFDCQQGRNFTPLKDLNPRRRRRENTAISARIPDQIMNDSVSKICFPPEEDKNISESKQSEFGNIHL